MTPISIPSKEDMNQAAQKAQKTFTSMFIAFILVFILPGMYGMSQSDDQPERISNPATTPTQEIYKNTQKLNLPTESIDIKEPPTTPTPASEKSKGEVTELNKPQQIDSVKSTSPIEPASSTNRDRLIDFVKTKNRHIDAVEFVDACLSTRLNCPLAIAMTGQESSFCNVFRLQKNGVWKNYNYLQVKEVRNSLTSGLVSYNCSGVKTRNGVGGNFQPLSDGYSGSIVGYKSWVDYFEHKEQIATRAYSAMLKPSVTLTDVQSISDRYVGGAGINIGWSSNVYNILKSI